MTRNKETWPVPDVRQSRLTRLFKPDQDSANGEHNDGVVSLPIKCPREGQAPRQSLGSILLVMLGRPGAIQGPLGDSYSHSLRQTDSDLSFSLPCWHHWPKCSSRFPKVRSAPSALTAGLPGARGFRETSENPWCFSNQPHSNKSWPIHPGKPGGPLRAAFLQPSSRPELSKRVTAL